MLVFAVCSLKASQLTLDEIVLSMERLLEDTREYSGVIDAAFKALLDEHMEEVQQLTQNINEKTASISRRSQAITKHIEFFQNQILSEEDQIKMEHIADLLILTERNFNPAQQRLAMLTKLTFKKNVNGVLKTLSSELEKSYLNKKSYPLQLEGGLNVFNGQPYTFFYQWIDPQHYKIVVEPLPEAVREGVVLEQKYVLTEDRRIQVFSLSDEVIEIIDLN